jgi:hypothetical protein
MKKNKTTEANKEFWSFVEKTSNQVREWPAWMRGDSHYNSSPTQREEHSGGEAAPKKRVLKRRDKDEGV